MKNKIFPVVKIVMCRFALLTLFAGFSVHAGVTTPLSGSGANTPDIIKTSTKYLVKISKSNEYGYSLNTFSELDTKDKTLVLANSLQMNPKLSGSPAQTIVLALNANQIASFSEIKVEGRAADVVILAPKGIRCDGCSVTNAERVTLATGEGIYESGELTSIALSSGEISVTGLGFSANQSSLVDLAAGKVTIDAPFTTNMKGRVVTRANKEVKEIDTAGTLQVSNGDVQIIVGDNAFRYSDRQSDASFNTFSGTALTLTSNADIAVGNLHLESTYAQGDVSIDGRILANGAWTYVGRYNNQSIVPLESVNVKSNGDILIYDQIIAANKVDLESTQDIRIIPEGGVARFGIDNIRAAEINIAAVGTVESTGAILGESVYLSARQVVNEGDVEASRDIYINGEEEIRNQFGGVLLSENILLKSDHDVVNGSLYPFRLLPKDDPATAGVQALSRASSINEKRVGARLSVPPPPETMMPVEVATLEAFILGQNIRIEANQFTNGNPYHIERQSVEVPELLLEYNKSSQVIVSAENTLDLRLKERFWNMSSIAESWTGNTVIEAPLIDNERYYLWADTFTYTEDVPRSSTCERYIFGRFCIRRSNPQDVSIKKYHQYIKALSPQARINTGGSLILSSQSLNNEHSAVEVKKDVVGTVNNVWMEGLSLRDIWETTTVTHHSRTYCTKKIWRKCIRRKTDHWTTSRTDLTKNEVTAQFPFVFYVDGHINQGFGKWNVNMRDIIFGPYATSDKPVPKPKPSKYIPIINSGITFFILNPNFKA
ncbi:hypothetical protein GCM10007938_32050 [Vibrio zhanjiangensis]|uniref:Filamentous haemagglutinin FhaB/tRNA nuclease CdiA-like TPS domain-containing protein n=1 Tax=Vibrio zhanjiangensis TaxID=1046128 RepID=A0ABQ6F1P2_9VIBR|nr:hypothetical protein [Vibrio zhanjiangensis]GLT19423.1 hypothetical protein GCM10007938_32050 [Vibrio zhanjiangensis]